MQATHCAQSAPASHRGDDVVARLRGKLKMKRIGHAGTLDPMATGLLVILVGKATKVSQYLVGLDKEYEGTIELGKVTDTQDAEGEVLETFPVPAFTEGDILAAVQSFLGDQYQTPPMYSAVKIDGVPLYKLARQGKTVEREPRFVHVYAHEIQTVRLPEIDFRVVCSKGFYVRTYAHDIGQELGCGAHLKSLRRTKSGRFSVEGAVTVDELKNGPREAILQRVLSLPAVSRLRGA